MEADGFAAVYSVVRDAVEWLRRQHWPGPATGGANRDTTQVGELLLVNPCQPKRIIGASGETGTRTRR